MEKEKSLRVSLVIADVRTCTIGGLARATGLTHKDVLEVLAELVAGRFVDEVVPGSRMLYAVSEGDQLNRLRSRSADLAAELSKEAPQ